VIRGRLAAAPALAAPVLAASDPYESLKAMDGHCWRPLPAAALSPSTINARAPACSSSASRRWAASRRGWWCSFPRTPKGANWSFTTQTPDSAADRPGPWHELTIEGDRWTYADLDPRRDVKRRERTVVTHSGPDFMHAEIQVSVDGESWTAVSSENLTRAR
jgi:hypothetical protein